MKHRKREKGRKRQLKKGVLKVLSMALGVSMMVGLGTSFFVSENAKTLKFLKTEVSAATEINALDELNSKIKDGIFTETNLVASLSEDKKQELKKLLVDGFNSNADNVAFSDLVIKKTSLTPSDRTRYWIPTLERLRKEKGLRPSGAYPAGSKEAELILELVKEADRIALELANSPQNDEMEVVAAEAKVTFEKFVNRLLESNPNLKIQDLKRDLPALYRGMLFLQQQYSFEDDLVESLIFEPHTIKGKSKDSVDAYTRLKSYGGNKVLDTRKGGYLKQSETLFIERKVAEYTGTKSVIDLIEALAKKKNVTAGNYFEQRTQAQVVSTGNKSVYDTLKDKRDLNYLIIPILSRGEGIYAGVTSGSISLGMLNTYADQESREAVLPHTRGNQQNKSPFFLAPLMGQENFMTFLNSVNRSGKEVPFVLAIDTMNHRVNGKLIWSAPEGENAAKEVRNFFGPLRLIDEVYKNEKNYGGQSNSPSSLVAYEKRLMNKDFTGVGLYAHEMTHGNDYNIGGVVNQTILGGDKRTTMGEEILTRSMFETEDNSQNKGTFTKPFFQFNTTTVIPDGDNRIQAKLPLNTKEKLVNYSKNLIDLIAYLEVKEAEIALTLPEGDRKSYFNQVSQVARGDGKKATTDKFMPSTAVPISVDDLVKKGYVSGQFIPNGTNRFATIIPNQYDYLPLLESFYAANVAATGMHTVGDLSVKRNAHEIMGWLGWDAFVAYMGKASGDTDKEVFTSLGISDWQEYKLNKYKELKEKTAVNENLWTEDSLNKSLKEAIDADLKVIKTNSDAAVYANAVNVRKVKQNILNKALRYNELERTVLKEAETKNIIYVSNTGMGTGKEQSSPTTLEAALAKAKDGYIIRFVDTVTKRKAITVDKKLIFEGVDGIEGEGLNLNEDLILNSETSWKNLKLTLNGEGKIVKSIYTNANTIFEGVSTQISPQQNDKRPALVIGKDAQGKKVEVQVKNNDETRFVSATFAGDGNLFIAPNVKIDRGIINEGKVAKVISQSNSLGVFENKNSGNLQVTIEKANPTDIELKDVTFIHLKDKSTASLWSVTGKPSIILDEGTNMMAKDVNLTVNEVKGPGKISFSDKGKLTADKLLNNPVIAFTRGNLDYSSYDGKVFVETKEGEAEVVLTDLGSTLSKDGQGKYIYIGNFKIYHDFENMEVTDPVIPEIVNKLKPKDNEKLKKAPKEPTFITQKVEDTDNDGVWEFKGWELNEQGSNDKVKHYIGIWDFIENTHTPDPVIPPSPQPIKKHRVYYSYEGDIPKGRETAPVSEEVEEGQTIFIPNDETDIEVADMDGIYSLTWDRSQTSMGDKDITIVGRWTLTKNKHKVIYVYEGDKQPSGDNLPQIPVEVEGFEGDLVVIPANISIKADGGIYSLVWTSDVSHIEREDVEVKGTWTFKEDQVTIPNPTKYRVIYDYSGDVPEDRQVPEEKEILEGELIEIPSDETHIVVDGIDGLYDLKWNRDITKMGTEDVRIIGEWTFVPNKHKISYHYVGDKLPPAELLPTLPNTVEGVKGDVVTPAQDTQIAADGGIYSLTWKDNISQIGTESVTVIGEWTFEKDKEKRLIARDVANGDWFESAVYFMYREGIMFGKGPIEETEDAIYFNFVPYDVTSRAEVATVFSRLDRKGGVKVWERAFPDVTENDWFYPNVKYIKDRGYMNGYADGRFGGYDILTREQFAKMLLNYMKVNNLDKGIRGNLKVYKDGDKVSAFAKEPMEWAVKSGIIKGKDGGSRLDPQGGMTRAEMAVMLERFLQIPEIEEFYRANRG